MAFPRMATVKQHFAAKSLPDPVAQVRQQLAATTLSLAPGARVAVAAGSRGIANIVEITRAVVDHLKACGAAPFVLPAMGSHGGATAEGQIEVLASYGITPQSMDAPIESTMEVEQIGTLDDGTPVLINKLAFAADGIVLINRVKPHTSFRGLFESGLMKMLTIGLGSHKGATIAHTQGAQGLARLIPEWGRVILAKTPVLFGVALVENAYEHTAETAVLKPEEFKSREPQLLVTARENMPRIMVQGIDVLIVEEMGKNISGTGMDTNVLGRMMLPGVKEPEEPGVARIVTLDLSERTHGNANGLGLADIVTRRLFDRIDFKSTYANAFTSTFLNRAYIPVIMETDQEAIEAAFSVQRIDNPANARVVRIKNTLEVGQIQLSETLLREFSTHPKLEQVSNLAAMAFNADGSLI
jgi:hypothetical protein